MAGVNRICKQKMSLRTGKIEHLLRQGRAVRNFPHFVRKGTGPARR
jgi:hypothetical protein